MIRKFFVQIILISLIVCFFGLNFDTKVDIKFWFNDSMNLEGVSLFIALAVAYALGILSFIPFYIARSFKKKKAKKLKEEKPLNTYE